VFVTGPKPCRSATRVDKYIRLHWQALTLIAPESAIARMGAGLSWEIRMAPDFVSAWTEPRSRRGKYAARIIVSYNGAPGVVDADAP